MEDVFKSLRHIMQKHAGSLNVMVDADDHYYLDTYHIQKNKKPLYFGGVKIQKNYVSYYLMPVYTNPELVEDLSADLTKRRQGKSCFNFKTADQALFDEMSDITKRAFESYQAQGFIDAS
jgi:hypothetical protein